MSIPPSCVLQRDREVREDNLSIPPSCVLQRDREGREDT